MDFLKKWFNKVIGWIAKPIALVMDKATALIGPCIAASKGEHKIKWSFKCVGKVLAGAMLLGLLVLTVATVTVMGIAGITLALGLILPSLLANVIAILGTLYIAYEVYQKIDFYRADVIEIEVEVEVEAQS